MASDPPDPGQGPGDGFDRLEQRAAAAADRGGERARSLGGATDSAGGPTPRPWSARTLAIVALVVLLFAGGAVVGWITQGGSTNDHVGVATTIVSSSVPAAVTTAVTPTSAVTAPTTVPLTSPTVAPPPPPPPADTSGAQMQHTVQAGESFWAIAEAEVARVTQHQPDLTQIDSYWRTLVRANADRLVHPGNPNLLYPGQVLLLPAVPASP